MYKGSGKIVEREAPYFFTIPGEVGRQGVQFHGQPDVDASLLGVLHDLVKQVFRHLKSLVGSFHVLHFRWRDSSVLEPFLPNGHVVFGPRAKSSKRPGKISALLSGDVTQPGDLALISKFQPGLIREPPE